MRRVSQSFTSTRLSHVTWGVLVAVAACSSSGAQTPLELGKKAFEAAASKLGAGSGQGRYRVFALEGRETLLEEVGFHLEYSGMKFHLDLEYRKIASSAQRDDRRVIVSDGTALFVNRISKSIKPAGCAGDVYSLDEKWLGIAFEGFPIYPYSRFGLITGNSSDAFDRYKSDPEKLSNGRYLYRKLDSPNWETVREIAPEYGYNTSMSGGTNTKGDKTYTYRRFYWKRSGGIWYVQRMVHDEKAMGIGLRRHELVYERFQPNPEIHPEMYTLAALELCEGGRIIDRRRDARTKYYTYNSEATRRLSEATLDSMVAQLKHMPPRELAKKRERTRSSTMRVLTIAFGGLLLVLVCFLWKKRRR